MPVGPLLLAPLFMRALGILRGDHSMGRRTQTLFVLAVALAGCAGAFTADPMDGDAGRSSAEEAGPLCQRSVRQSLLDISVPMGGGTLQENAKAARNSWS